MTSFLGQQWLDENSSRNFPLFDDATRLSDDESFTLPNNLIVDLRLAAPPSFDATLFYISKTAAFGSGLVITIANDGVDVASVTIPLAGFIEFSTFVVAALPGFDVGGTIVIGNAASAIAAGNGEYTFGLEATQILPTCIFPAIPSVTSITIIDSFGASQKLTGAVALAAGDNTELDVSGQTISFSMDSGVVLVDPCGADSGGVQRKPVRSISGVSPDEDGNIDLVGTDCLVVTPITSGVKLSDSCAQPCCGSPELDALAASVKLINTQLATLAGNDAALENALRILLAYAGQ